jgi:flagellar biosynthesis protein FliR
MPNSLAIPVFPFLLVLARVAGVFALVPMPGFRSAPEPVRAAFALAVTLALAPAWPRVANPAHAGQLALWIVAEAAFGLAIGIVVAMLLEAFSLAAQIFGLQAGYAYASTVDPNTQADSGVLLVVAQLAAGMLFFALGLDREVVRLLALSLERLPPGAYGLSRGAAETVVRLGDAMFGVALRLAFPVVALLLMADMALALTGKLNQHLQLLSLAFPVKMLCALAVLAAGAALFPRLLGQSAEVSFRALRQLIGT